MSELVEKISDAVEHLTNLEITTAVGEVEDIVEDGQVVDKRMKPGSAQMYTRIDLLQGDIRTLMDEAFVTGEYAALRPFHQSREASGRQIIEDNLHALRALLAFVREELDPQQAGGGDGDATG